MIKHEEGRGARGRTQCFCFLGIEGSNGYVPMLPAKRVLGNAGIKLQIGNITEIFYILAGRIDDGYYLGENRTR